MWTVRAFGVAIIAVFVNMLYEDVYKEPLLKLSFSIYDIENDHSVTELGLENKGQSPATNLRVTIDSNNKILYFEAKSDEEISSRQIDSIEDRLIMTMPRLTKEAFLSTILTNDFKASDVSYSIDITHDSDSIHINQKDILVDFKANDLSMEAMALEKETFHYEYDQEKIKLSKFLTKDSTSLFLIIAAAYAVIHISLEATMKLRKSKGQYY
jgi:hypothetical protein